MENFSQIYNKTVDFLLTILESEEICHQTCKRPYSSIIKTERIQNSNYDEKIKTLLKTCDEFVLQKLWFRIFKNCYSNDIKDIFKNELSDRSFFNSLWCQEVLNNDMPSSSMEQHLSQVDNSFHNNQLEQQMFLLNQDLIPRNFVISQREIVNFRNYKNILLIITF